MKIKKYIQFIKENNTFKYNNIIDYTLLEESSTDSDIIELCKKADNIGVKSVCIFPKYVALAKEQLKDSKVLVCTVVSFPKGSNTLDQKISETNQVIKDGADEVDMVINYHLFKTPFFFTGEDEQGKEGNYNELVNEVKSLADICHSKTNKNGERVILKVIVESGLLSEEQTEIVTNICLDAGADFIKTSTGKSESPGAEINKVIIMYNTIKESGSIMKIKASGGIRTIEDIKKFKPYVDRFGMGYQSVDNIFGINIGHLNTKNNKY